MKEALIEASRAFECGEVPVGAVMVEKGRIIARAHNMREHLADPTAHAEILVMREAARIKGTWRLNGTTIYCTLEPCSMCAGAMINARIKRVVYGAADHKSGACESIAELFDIKEHNHAVAHTGGVMTAEGLKLLGNFFKEKRKKNNLA